MHHFQNNLINIGIVLHPSKTDPPIFKNSIIIDHVMISQLSHLIFKRESFPFLLRKIKTEEKREDEPSAGKVSASEAAPGENLRACVKKTSCLPNDGSKHLQIQI